MNMSEEIILDDIEIEETPQTILQKSDYTGKDGMEESFLSLSEEALEIARPRAIYKITFIEEKKENGITVGGVEFKSRVLAVNLEDARRIFPFVATCGRELNDWAHQFDDMMKNYMADDIKEIFLNFAREQLKEHISQNFNPGEMASMNPGSLEDWPIGEQQKLFQLLGDVHEKIGVELTDSNLMEPNKSVSGIWFPTEKDYQNCRLCSREDCPNREAKFDEELYQKRYS